MCFSGGQKACVDSASPNPPQWPGYKGGNPTYAACYGQILAGAVPCAPGLPSGSTPYVLGNAIPTNDGVNQSVPWTYGAGGYVPQSYPMGRTLQLPLRYRP
jgi:hypothetical protein